MINPLPRFDDLVKADVWVNGTPDDRRTLFQGYKREYGKLKFWKGLKGDDKFTIVREMEKLAGLYEEPPKPPGLIGKSAIWLSEQVDKGIEALPEVPETQIEGYDIRPPIPDFTGKPTIPVQAKPAIPLPARQPEAVALEALGMKGIMPIPAIPTQEPLIMEEVIPESETKISSEVQKGVKSALAYIPYLTVRGLRGLTHPLFAPLEGTAMDTNKLIEQAIEYWSEKTPEIALMPDIGIGVSPKGKLKLERRATPLKEMIGITAEATGAISGPIKVAFKAASLVTKLPQVAAKARPFYLSIMRGMVAGSLLGEGKPQQTLEDMALFGVFDPIAYGIGKVSEAPKLIKNSATWRKMSIKERGLILQSLDDTIQKNPDISEGDILRNWENPMWRKQALKRRVVGEKPEEVWGLKKEPIVTEIPKEAIPKKKPIAPEVEPTVEVKKPPTEVKRPPTVEEKLKAIDEAARIEKEAIGKEFEKKKAELKKPPEKVEKNIDEILLDAYKTKRKDLYINEAKFGMPIIKKMAKAIGETDLNKAVKLHDETMLRLVSEGKIKKITDTKGNVNYQTLTKPTPKAKEVWDTTTTGMPFYDGLMKKGEAKIVMMTPDEYITQQAKAKKVPLVGEVEHIGVKYPKEYAERMKKGEKAPLPIIDWVEGGQEGRARVLAAKQLGQKEIPVVVRGSHPDYPELGKVVKKIEPKEVKEVAKPISAEKLTPEEYYKPGNVIWTSYWRKYDKVLDFKKGVEGERWEVKVQDSDKEGNLIGIPRWHSTPPSKGDVIIKEAKKIVPKPEPKVVKPAVPKLKAKPTSLAEHVEAAGGILDKTLPGELRDLTTGWYVKGGAQKFKAVPAISKKGGYPFDDMRKQMEEIGYKYPNEDTFRRRLEEDLAAIAQGKPENRIRPIQSLFANEEKMWDTHIKEQESRGIQDRETISRGIEKKVTSEVAKEDEFNRLSDEIFQEEYNKLSQEVKPTQATLIPKEEPKLELKMQEGPPKLVGPLHKKAVFPTGKIKAATKGEQVSILPRKRGEQITLGEKPEPKPAVPKADIPTPKPGFVWIKNKQKPFTEYREIKKGKDKDKIEVTLSDGKKVIVGKDAVRVWPEGKEAKPVVSKQKEIERRKAEAVPSILEIKPIESEVARSQIIKNIEEKLEIPIRKGRFRQKALGIYKEKERVIRLKRPNDVEVAIHEIAHDIQRLMDIKEIPAEVMAMAYKGAKVKDIPKEGFAEFVRYYVTDQVKAKKKAPIFYEKFEQLLKEYPDVQGVLVQARQAWESWIALPSVDKVGSFIKEGSDRKKMPTMNELYTWGVDELRPLQVLTNRVKEKGIPMGVKDDPFLLAWLTRGWSRKAEQYLRWGTFQLKEKGVEFRSDSLKNILAPIEKAGQRQMLDRYLVAKRAVNDPRILKGFENILSKEDFAQTVKELEPRFKDVAEKLYKYSDNLIEYLVDSGRISQDLAETIKKKNLFYTPLYRVMDGDTSLQGLSRKKYGNLFNPIRKLRGSSRDMHSPTESLMYNTFAMINVAERNRVGEALIKISELEGMGEFIEKLPVPIKPMKMTTREALTEMAKSQGIDTKGFITELGLSGEENKPILNKVITAFRANYNPQKGEVIFYKRGEPQVFVLDPDLHKAVMSMDAESLGTIVKLAAYPAKWLRAGATLSPEFVIRNPARDQLTAFLYSKYNFVPAYDLIRGIFHIVGKTEIYQQFNASGAAHAAVVSLDRDYLSKNLKEILASKIRQLPHVIKNPLETMQIISELTEEATRVGEFAKGLRESEGLEGLLKAGLAARDVTLDFQRIGLKTKGMNAITAFWNAQIQGVDKMTRAFKDNPGRTSLKVFAGITLPSILLWYAQKDDPYYQEIPPWRRILFWNIVTHKEDGSLKRIWSIPKPFEPGILFGSLPEMALDWIYTQNPEGFKETLKALLESTSPGFIPTMFVPIVEWIANRQLFFDRPVVPRSKEDLEPRLQYAPHTSETIKLVAEGMSKVPVLKEYASPAKIQTLIRGYTAGVGRAALEGIDALIKRLGVIDIPPDPAMTLSDIPGIRAFTARFPTASTRSIEMFYKQYIKRKTKWESAKEDIGVRGEGAKIAREVAKIKPLELIADEIVAKALSVKRKISETIYENRQLNPDEKLKLLNANYWDMINIARTRLGKEAIPSLIPLPSKKEIKPAIPLVGMGKK